LFKRSVFDSTELAPLRPFSPSTTASVQQGIRRSPVLRLLEHLLGPIAMFLVFRERLANPLFQVRSDRNDIATNDLFPVLEFAFLHGRRS
jgi:hypothetical protein